MSEAPTPAVADTGPSSEADFEAARLAEAEYDAGEEGAEPEADAEGDEPKAEAEPDWKKRALDKEGLAAKERAKRREAERQVRELNARLERLEATVTKPQASQADSIENLIASIPDPEEDPVGATAAMTKILRMFGQQQAEETQATERQTVEQQRIQTLVRAMDEAEADFTDDHPDYPEAVKHYKAARQSEFEDMGYSGQQLQAALAQDLLGLAQRAIAGGRDPAEVVYNLAKKRGFLSGQAAAVEKINEVAQAAKAAKAPAASQSGEPGRLSVDAINKLKGAAYESAWAKMREQQRRAG